MIEFYSDDAAIPHILRTNQFVIRPLTPDHVNLDYAALMTNKEMLRLWSGSSWPNDNFTIAENLEDLKWHWDEHQKRIAFTFTVLNTKEDACLGCVYIKPFTEILADNPELKMTYLKQAEVADSNNVALVRFWVVQSALTQKLDKSLLGDLRHWFSSAWAFPNVYWHTHKENKQQIALFRSNRLHQLGYIQMPDRGGAHILFA